MGEEVFLVPAVEVDDDGIDEAVAGLGGSEQPAEEGFLRSWRLGDARIRLFEDDVLHVVHLEVTGPDRASVADRLRAVISTYSLADMPALFASVDDDDSLVDLYMLLAAVAPEEPAPSALSLFRAGFAHDDPLVRWAAVIASRLPLWEALRPDFERLAGDDDEDVRRAAAGALDKMARRA